jgi:hypothetical protein
MKKVKVIMFVFAIGCFSTGLIAQNVSDLPSNSFPFNLGGQTVMRYDKRYVGVKGFHTFFENFQPGAVELKKGEVANGWISYDAYSDNVLARIEKTKDTVQLRKDLINSFVIKRPSVSEVVFVKKEVNGVPTFLYELSRDSISMYCKVSKKIVRAEIGGAYNTTDKKYDEFVTENTYFVTKSGALVELPKSKKGVVRTFPEFEDHVSDFFKVNKIDFNDYNHMKSLIAFINTL